MHFLTINMVKLCLGGHVYHVHGKKWSLQSLSVVSFTMNMVKCDLAVVFYHVMFYHVHGKKGVSAELGSYTFYHEHGKRCLGSRVLPTHLPSPPPPPPKTTHNGVSGFGPRLDVSVPGHHAMPLYQPRTPRTCTVDVSRPPQLGTWRPRKPREVVAAMTVSAASGSQGASEKRPLQHRRAGEADQAQLAGPSRSVALEALVGTVMESREAHTERCQEPRCPRCRWYEIGHTWQATYGAIQVEAGPREKIIWLQERPARWKGTWALGCSICADALARRQVLCGTAGTLKTAQGQSWRTSCAWARYETRSQFLQAEHLKQHACPDAHKLAVQAFLRPDEPVHLVLQGSHSDDRLLAGAVPQVVDWLRAWRWTREGDSWASAERHAFTEHWIDQLRCQSVVKRRAVRSMAMVMREVIRAKKREWVRASTCISISFDDRKAHKLVKFTCDVPLRHRGAPSQAPWVSGIIGCLDKVHGETLETMDDDYAEQTSVKIMDMIDKFATPLGMTSRDDEVYNKFRLATRSIVVDGALLKSARLLRANFLKSVVIIARDPAHMVRTAVSEPWIRTGRFEEQHRMLFSGKHALIKDVQHSEVLQARLQACQEDVLQERGSQGGGLVNVLRHFSFAPHRWESFAAPRRQYCCMLVAMFKCLGGIAGDWRIEKPRRERAETCMDAMSGRHALEVGIAGDYSEVCMQFIRLWDRPDKDPAVSSRAIADFRHRIDTLFVKGYILCDPEDRSDIGGSGLDGPGVTAGPRFKTITQIASEQLVEGADVTIDVMGKQKRLWWSASKKAVLEMMAEVKSAVAAMLARLDADFSPNSLYLCFEAFDLVEWEPIVQAGRVVDDTSKLPAVVVQKYRELRRKGRRIFEAMNLEWDAAQFISAVRAAVACSARVPPNTPKHVRNRAIWAEALAAAQGPNPIHGAAALLWAEPALRFYWSFRDGTGDVERLLGQHTVMQASHPGSTSTDDSAEICLELHAEGPCHESEVAAQPEVPGGVLLLTSFSRECARVWRTLFGARFACQSRRKDLGRHFADAPGTFKHVRVQHGTAVQMLLQAAIRDEEDTAATSERRTILGFRRRAIERSDAPAPVPGKSMRNFLKRTIDIAKEKAKHFVWSGCADRPELRRKEKPQLEKVRNFAIRFGRARAASVPSRGSVAKATKRGHDTIVDPPQAGVARAAKRSHDKVVAPAPSPGGFAKATKRGQGVVAKAKQSHDTVGASAPSRGAAESCAASSMAAAGKAAVGASAPSRGATESCAASSMAAAGKAAVSASAPSRGAAESKAAMLSFATVQTKQMTRKPIARAVSELAMVRQYKQRERLKAKKAEKSQSTRGAVKPPAGY